MEIINCQKRWKITMAHYTRLWGFFNVLIFSPTQNPMIFNVMRFSEAFHIFCVPFIVIIHQVSKQWLTRMHRSNTAVDGVPSLHGIDNSWPETSPKNNLKNTQLHGSASWWDSAWPRLMRAWTKTRNFKRRSTLSRGLFCDARLPPVFLTWSK